MKNTAASATVCLDSFDMSDVITNSDRITQRCLLFQYQANWDITLFIWSMNSVVIAEKTLLWDVMYV